MLASRPAHAVNYGRGSAASDNQWSVMSNTGDCDILGYSAGGSRESTGAGKYASFLFSPARSFAISFVQAYFMKKRNSSMQLTRAADYGVRVMVHLATLGANERALLPALADATDTPESFLSKVLQALSRAELISSKRGKSGGFAILPRGRQASMLEIIEAIEGPICLNVCLASGKSCAREAHCPAHPVWAKAQQAMVQILAQTVIAELAARSPARPVRGICCLQASESTKRISPETEQSAVG